MPRPRRRHTLTLRLEADTVSTLVGTLHYLADDIEAEDRDERDLTAEEYAVNYELALRTDPAQDGESYRRQYAEWMRSRREGE